MACHHEPPGTAYDGYIFKLLIEVPEEYHGAAYDAVLDDLLC